MEKKSLALTAAACCICFVLGVNVSSYVFLMSLHQNPTLRANVFYVMEKHGMDARMVQGNVITDRSEKFTRNHFSRTLSMNVTKLAVGNVTGTLQTKNTLDAVYTDPTDGAYVEGTINEWENAGDSAYNSTKKWTFEETVNLNGAAAYYGNTTYCYAVANFPGGAQTFNNGENLTVRFVFTFNAND